VSPVADKLKEFLTKVNWARAGLGLPLVSTLFSFPVARVTKACEIFWVLQLMKHYVLNGNLFAQDGLDALV